MQSADNSRNDSIKECLRWFSTLPFNKQLALMNAVLDENVEYAKRLIEEGKRYLFDKLIDFLKSGIDCKEIEELGISYGLEESTVKLLSAVHNEITKSPMVVDIIAMRNIPVEEFRELVRSVVQDYIITNRIDPITNFKGKYNLPEAEAEKVSRGIINYLRIGCFYSTYERLIDYLQKNGLDKERAKILADAIKENISQLRAWFILDKIDDIEKELDRASDENRELRRSIERLSLTLREMLQSIKDLMSRLGFS